MSWVLIILRVLANLPALIAIVKEIIAFIQAIQNGKEQKAELAALNVNLKAARKDRNFTPIRDQLERLRKRHERQN